MSNKAPFKFDLNQQVEITCSGEKGKIISRAEHTTATSNYRIQYKCADGRAVECWWDEDALEVTLA